MDLAIKTNKNEQKDIWEVLVSGEIDIFNSQDFKSALLDLLEESAINLRINCQDLAYIDSTGLGSLIAILKKAKEKECEVFLTNVKPNLLKLFKITNLDKVFIIEGDDDEQ